MRSGSSVATVRTALDLAIVLLLALVIALASWFVTESADAGRLAGLVALAIIGLVYAVALVWSWLKGRLLSGLRW